MASALERLSPEELQRLLTRFFGSVNVFAVFYLLVTTLVFRWDTFLGPRYARYAGVFLIDWQLLTATFIVFILLLIAIKEVRSGIHWEDFVRRTAVTVNALEAFAAIAVLVAITVVLLLVYYALGLVFPLDTEEILFLVPVLTVAALSETFAYQWFLARTFDSQWRLGFLWAQIAFALAHPNLTIVSFGALLMLGLVFYYLTNPSGNLPFWVNIVFSGGVHVIYNVFAFAYGGAAGFLVQEAAGVTATSIAFWAIVVLVVALVAVGERRSRLRKTALS